MKQKILITGGCGFLGSTLAQCAFEKGYSITLYDNAPFPGHLNPEIQHAKNSILDLDSIKAAAKGSEFVFHAAAIADIEESRRKPIETIKVNVLGTVNVLEASRLAGVQRFVLASSIYVAGKLGSFYRVSKLAAEELVKTYFEEFKLPYTIVRYGSLYGANANNWNMIYLICRDLLTQGKYEYYGSGQETREFIHIRDAAWHTLKIAESAQFAGKTVLITGHQRMSMNELFGLLREILGSKVKFVCLNHENHGHYKITPYLFDDRVPIRVTLDNYVDINEGILECLNKARADLERTPVGA